MITILEDIFIALLAPFYNTFDKLNQRARDIVLRLLFVGLIFLFIFVRILKTDAHYPYYTVIGIILSYLIAGVAVERKLVHLKWKKGITFAWFFLCVSIIISDFFVPKSFYNLGYILLFSIPLIAFSFQNSERTLMLWEDFFYGTRWAFVITTIVAFLFRTRKPGYRYAAIFINPNMLGLFLVGVATVYLYFLDQKMKDKQSLIKCIPLFIEVGVGVFLLIMTQARTSMIAVGFTIFCWFVVRFVEAKARKCMALFWKYILVLLGMIILIFPVSYKLLEAVPSIIKPSLEYKKDLYYAKENNHIFITVAYASDGSNPVITTEPETKGISNDSSLNRIFDGLENASIRSLLNGRVEIYEEYTKQLNWKGHKKISIKKDGHKLAHAHNNMLQFAFSYGYLGAISYVLLTIFSLCSAVAFWRKSSNKCIFAIYPFLFVVGFLVSSLVESIFLPFMCYPAFIYWLFTANLMMQHRNNSEKVGE